MAGGDSGANTGGVGSSSGAGNATGGNAGVSGNATTGGAGVGGSAMSSGGAGTSGSASGGATGVSGAGPELFECDPKKVLCKIVAPQCAQFEVPSVAGNCYGPCVKIDRCACAAANQCPDPDQYTCWGSKHCGPYVN